MTPRYALITPLQNEEATIGRVVESVKKQSLIPAVWVIVDDGSTDRSAQILAGEIADAPWIHVLKRGAPHEYDWLGYGDVVNDGIDFLNRLTAVEKGRAYDYLGLLDADITVEERYFEKLIDYLASNPGAGVVSGDVMIRSRRGREKPWSVEYDKDFPRGGARVYKATVLGEIGGFPRTPSPDKTSDIKIMGRGYEARRIPAVRSFQHRETFAKENQLKGFFVSGRGRYMLHFNFFHVIVISMKAALGKKPFLAGGFMFFCGYVGGFLTRAERIRDDDVIRYSRNFLKRALRRNECPGMTGKKDAAG